VPADPYAGGLVAVDDVIGLGAALALPLLLISKKTTTAMMITAMIKKSTTNTPPTSQPAEAEKPD
jgi:hypothetical protein